MSEQKEGPSNQQAETKVNQSTTQPKNEQTPVLQDEVLKNKQEQTQEDAHGVAKRKDADTTSEKWNEETAQDDSNEEQSATEESEDQTEKPKPTESL